MCQNQGYTRDRRLSLKPALYSWETNHLAPYLGPFGAYLMPQWRIKGSKLSLKCGGQLTLFSIWSKKPLVFVKNKTPKDYMVDKTYHLSWYLGSFLGIYNDSWTHIRYKRYRIIVRTLTQVIFNMVKNTLVLVKNDPKRIKYKTIQNKL